MGKFLNRISDITKIHHRAAFIDVADRIAPKKSAFLELASKRYSCRTFRTAPVEQSKIESILEAGRLAPTAANRQPVHVWAIIDEESRFKLADATKYTFGAPCIFLIGVDKEKAWVRGKDGKNSSDIDTAIVCTHMMLEAADLGLGTTWVGSFDPEKVAELIPQTKGYEIVAILPTGYPGAEASANHTNRISMENFSTII
ncbi:MAG: nitroreductase family protein [Bacteroidales bacterium]|nr:nitroreductase family protein [Bacteroidales bacterium]MCR5243397.1 nitroreductase family protein [Bacteroidales bacterium]MDT3357020.1 nitroreductase family protein [Bacteroidota bacterium]